MKIYSLSTRILQLAVISMLAVSVAAYASNPSGTTTAPGNDATPIWGGSVPEKKSGKIQEKIQGNNIEDRVSNHQNHVMERAELDEKLGITPKQHGPQVNAK